jgi:hypothetical protein
MPDEGGLMHFRGPAADEFADVEALNRAYLDHLRRSPVESAGVSCGLAARLAALDEPQIHRLARAPFLLFSLREDDAAYWSRILADRHRGDLFSVSDRSTVAGRLGAAAVAYVWQLAKQDRHLARLVCGASPEWCDILAERPLFELLECCARRSDLLELRRAGDQAFWRRLLEAGTSEVETVSSAAHISALQVLLTRPDQRPGRRLDAAACRFPAVATRVGEAPGSD